MAEDYAMSAYAESDRDTPSDDEFIDGTTSEHQLNTVAENYSHADHLFERLADAFFGPDYKCMSFMQSYGPEHSVQSSSYYGQDNSDRGTGAQSDTDTSSEMPLLSESL